MKVVSCVIDFTETSKIAATYAIWLAKQYNASINLVHFTAIPGSHNDLEEKLVAHTEIESSGIAHTFSIGSGNYLRTIPEMLLESEADVVVMGSEGTQNAPQILTSANVVRLVQVVPIPALVVQRNSPVPVRPIHDILFPMAPHSNFAIKIEESARWAKMHNAHIDILCLVASGHDLPADIKNNLDEAGDYFSRENVNYSQTFRDSKVYGVGYAKDILRYAEDKPFDLIVVMSQNSAENMYFGNVEKTNLIQNDLGIPVLCINS